MFKRDQGKMVRHPGLSEDLLVGARALVHLERLVATVKGKGSPDEKLTDALAALDSLARKEGIPIAIIGGMAAIYHGYERFTKDIDVVVSKTDLDPLIRVAPQYGIKVIWRDPNGWHKLRYADVNIEIVPEGGMPKKYSPTTIPGVQRLGIKSGAGYASLEGWIETKIASDRSQDRADVVQVMKKTPARSLRRIRTALGKIHPSYLSRFDELQQSAEQEKQQEKERGRW
jgi:hypothetical protein